MLLLIINYHTKIGRKRGGSRNKGKNFSGKAQTESRWCPTAGHSIDEKSDLPKPEVCWPWRWRKLFVFFEFVSGGNNIHWCLSPHSKCTWGCTKEDKRKARYSRSVTGPQIQLVQKKKTVGVKFRIERGKTANFHMQKEGAAVIWQMLRPSNCCLLASLLFPSFLSFTSWRYY